MTHMMEQQQLAVRDTNHAYLESRANAVDAVQGTIAELGNIFQALYRTLNFTRANPHPHPHPHPHQS